MTTTTFGGFMVARALRRGEPRVQSSDSMQSLGKVCIQPSPATTRDDVHALLRQASNDAAPRIDAGDEKYPSRTLPCGLQPRRVPEQVARVDEGGAEREVRLQAVHDPNRR